MLRTGVDIIEIERIRWAVDRFGPRFLTRVFTARELAQSRRRVESLAGRFAGKEAVAKALGSGIWREGITWTDIEIGRNVGSGAPELHLAGAAARRSDALGLCEWSLSISHDRGLALAFAVAMGPSVESHEDNHPSAAR